MLLCRSATDPGIYYQFSKLGALRKILDLYLAGGKFSDLDFGTGNPPSRELNFSWKILTLDLRATRKLNFSWRTWDLRTWPQTKLELLMENFGSSVPTPNGFGTSHGGLRPCGDHAVYWKVLVSLSILRPQLNDGIWNQIQDFPDGGRQPRVGSTNLLFWPYFFYRELREIEKHFTEGRVPSALH